MPTQLRLGNLLEWTEATRRRERARISNHLHDETGALLTAAGLKLELLRMDGVEGLDAAIDTLERAFDSVRRLSRDVHPEFVERVGLSTALAALVESSAQHFAGTLQGDLATTVTGPTELYRIAEEVLDNAIRHSKASTIQVLLTDSGELIVRDNGIGFRRDSPGSGLGLLRVRYLGARAHLRVRLRTAPESGTIIRVTQLKPCHSTSY